MINTMYEKLLVNKMVKTETVIQVNKIEPIAPE